MDDELKQLNGLGEKRIEILNSMGIFTIDDLLMYAPTSYMDFSDIHNICDVSNGELAAFELTVTSPPHRVFTKSGMSLVSASAKDDSGSVSLVWFNQPYMENKYYNGQLIYVYGRMDTRHGRQLNAPIIYTYNPKIVPNYSLKRGISRAIIIRCMKNALSLCYSMSDTLPEYMRQQYSLMTRIEALNSLHFPQDTDLLKNAKRRIAFEDMLYFRVVLNITRTSRQKQFANPCNTHNVLETLKCKLSFSLTDSQLEVMAQIKQDLECSSPMCRLLQGDVGSGKTLVAFYAMMCSANSGLQSAMLAPTEILAQQHYATLTALVDTADVCLLTGSMTKKQKEIICQQIKSGAVKYVIGTHALFEADVEFNKLNLIICDEQQRFGVTQRSIMRDDRAKRGCNAIPHMLAMSATPIPRTLALVMFGDLDVSAITTMPHGRKPVKTRIVLQNKRSAMYHYIAENAAQGKQTYVVCPLIESDNDDFPLGSAKEVFDELKALLSVPVGLLHGKMRPKQKDEVIEKFRNGEIKVLVSTTVIEVGVDVPNAVNMVIECAERFGLSQLHQLRGRVGRSNLESYCFLLPSNDAQCQRLNALCQSNDGFFIAQRDLELRGPGQFLGNVQHGESEYGLLSLAADMETLNSAQQAADELFVSFDAEGYTKIIVEHAIKKYGRRDHLGF